MRDNTVRRLTALQETASTARVLNLSFVHNQLEHAEALSAAPFFSNKALDRAIIVKHRLRLPEYIYFKSPISNATKIMIPIDNNDLRLGARFVFMGQLNFDKIAAEAFGDDLRPGNRDRTVLELISSLPSLDPFLLREQLSRNNIHPAREYFNISDADIARMQEFIRSELASLAAICFGSDGPGYSQRLMEKLIAATPNEAFEPLRAAFHLSEKQYADGIFSWRGFLYYKWVLAEIEPEIALVSAAVATIQPRGPKDEESSAYLPEARSRISRVIMETRAGVAETLSVYDKAYQALVKGGEPTAFRDFLLAAPEMFVSLGERLGALQHIASFWKFKFKGSARTTVSPPELMDVFLDFEDSMSF